MIRTPIDDFVRAYAEGDTLRMHMPGHKGVGDIEKYDLTEIKGADSLFSPDGIIKESEKIASELFGAHTFYSTEGSSHAIRAMLYLAALGKRSGTKRATVLAGRNAHKAFISALALLDLDCEWLTGGDDYISSRITPEIIREKLSSIERMPIAVYLTSPDYLGNMLDIKAIAELCHERGILLLVDNAHGAYLKMLEPSCHPIDLGADMCTDSAHKTLPCLTGGAYLHISRSLNESYKASAKRALELFGSTSPSYLTLASLDRTNRHIEKFKRILPTFISKIDATKHRLTSAGYTLVGDEPMKISILTAGYGYRGDELAELLREEGIECEFSDCDHIVFMPSPIDPEGVAILENALLAITAKAPIAFSSPAALTPKRILSVREASFSEAITLPIDECIGRIVAVADVSCPPAVPILMPGELVDRGHIDILRAWGKETLTVVK